MSKFQKQLLKAGAILFLAGGAVAPVTGGEEYPFPWATYTTMFKTGIDAREHNIIAAARLLNGVLLLPGVEFSFNETVTTGIPEEELGLASSLIGAKRVPSEGGGLCQVSSTLYATALLAGISVRERTPHSVMVSYVPPGFDAMVSRDEGTDMKLQNPYGVPLLIRTEVAGRSCTVSIRGKKRRPGTIAVIPGRPERMGEFIGVTTIRTSSFGGKTTAEIVSRDRYLVPSPSREGNR